MPKVVDEGGICNVIEGLEREGGGSMERGLGALETRADVANRPLFMVFKGGSAVVFLDNFNPFQEKGAVSGGNGVSSYPFEGSDGGLIGEDISLEKEFSKLIDFSRFLGMSVDGFEEEIRSMLRKLRKKVRGGNLSKGRKKKLASSSRSEMELRRLDCSISYGGFSLASKRRGKNNWELIPIDW